VAPPSAVTPEVVVRVPLGRLRVGPLGAVFVAGAVFGAAMAALWPRAAVPRPPVDERARVFEAESRSNVFGGSVRIEGCPACSGGGRVKWIGRRNDVRVTVTVAEEGDYSLQLDYLLDGARTLFVSVNDGAALELLLRGTSWNVPASTGFSARLRPGPSTLRFFNDRAHAPDLDRIVLR
jgi:hypothetical protein